ncbi:MAG TPA: insulinase family protein, partial [Gemmatimonadales bacterium]|nr:insulinase family protein [Gemmatimonadales bacterium]
MRLALLGLLGVAAPLAAQAPGPIAFERFTLPNGLEVVLAPDSLAPVVAVNLWVFGGTRYDPPGRGGLAQLFRRLAFAGSGHVTRGEHERLVTSAHGFYDAEVEDEAARFSETMPPERLNLALWLEAERLRGLKLDDSALALARRAELESRTADAQDAFAEPILTAVASLYDSTACFPYAHLGRGTPASLGAVTRPEVEAFFRRHYVPRNARLVVAGGFDREQATRLVTAYFGEIPPGEPVP